MAITALVLGIVSLPTACVLIGPLLGLVALILGIVALVRVNKRPVEYGGKGMAIAGICCGAASFLLVLPLALSITLPSLSRARELAKRAVCAAQLQAIGQSCQIYAGNNAGWFPPDLQRLIDMGHVTPAALQCPSESNPSELVFDYVYVPGLQATVPVDWILAYEDPANHNGEGGNVLYVDTHIEFLKTAKLREELERIRREIEASEYADHPWYRDHPLIVP
ncbi:MAG TPA: DUF4190 domain-containing protein [Phycisphaerae bacterium]|nr:DUF4190 domain-containing protein [Phycisphaerae bacterium]